ncbi:hypothetical protein BH09BAC5_BH09BAC5_23660 [soil metagenome]
MRKQYSILFICLLILLSACRSRKLAQQTPIAATASTPDQVHPATVPDDMQVVISEDMMNKCFKALGSISGKEPYQILFVNDSFTWVLANPMIHLHEGKADFTTDVNVIAGSFMYTTSCTGDVAIWYDRPKNLINVKIMRCIVEIYTKVFGTKYHLKDVDLASKFTDPFTFEGPTATSTYMEMEMPDGSVRTLYMHTTDCDLSVKEKQIVVPCEVEFSLTPPPSPPVIKPAPKK